MNGIPVISSQVLKKCGQCSKEDTAIFLITRKDKLPIKWKKLNLHGTKSLTCYLQHMRITLQFLNHSSTLRVSAFKTAFRNSVPRHKEVHWLHHRCSLWRGIEFLKAVLKAELCFHRYVHFSCVPIYVFGLHHKQCASD